jgi:hypothetical protein
VNPLDDALVHIAPDGVILTCTPAASLLLGHPVAELLGLDAERGGYAGLPERIAGSQLCIGPLKPRRAEEVDGDQQAPGAQATHDLRQRMLQVFNMVQRRLREDDVVTAPPVVGVVHVRLDKVNCMAIGSPTRGLDAFGRQLQARDAAEDPAVQQAALETTVAAAQAERVGRRELRVAGGQELEEPGAGVAEGAMKDFLQHGGVVAPVGEALALG